VLNLTFKVKWLDRTTHNATEAYGFCCYDTQTIGISEGLAKDQMADVFLHEIIHALYFAMGLKEGSDEESVAHRVATGLCTVFKSNPKFFKWWSDLL
jgi:hypothetical protein